MGAWILILEIVELLAAALLCGILAQKLRQDPVVGYLVAGILLGPGVLGIVRGADTVRTLAELGVALLLFTIGLEFSWAKVRELGRLATIGGTLQILLTIAVAATVALAFRLPPSGAFVLGCALSMSSTAVTVRVLADRMELDGIHGRGALAILLMQDLAVVPLLVVISAASGGRPGAEGLLVLGGSFVKAGLLVLAFWVAARFVFPRLFLHGSTPQNRDFSVVLAVAMFLGCAWAAHSQDLSPVLGAFVAGMLLADLPYADQIRADVIPLRAAFVTLFFSSIGMLATVPSGGAWLVLPVAVAGIVLVKTVVVVAVFLMLRQPLRVAIRTGLVLAQIGEFSFVLAEVARQHGLIDNALFQPLVSSAVVSLMLTPYLIRAAPHVATAVSTVLGLRSRELTHDRGLPRTGSPRVIVVGYGPAGQAVVRALKESDAEFLVLDLNPRTVVAKRMSVPMHYGDATRREILERAGIAKARAVIVTVPDPGAARTIVSQARQLAPGVPIVARGRYHMHMASLRDAGAGTAVDEEVLVGTQLAAEAVKLIGADSQVSPS